MAVKIGINGFGRIGRNIFRASLGDSSIDIVAVNDVADPKTLAYLLKHDSILGNLPNTVTAGVDSIYVDGKPTKGFKISDPAQIDWSSVGAQIVIESTGHFTKGAVACKHLRGTVQKVIISAPSTDADLTVVLGVNDKMYDPVDSEVVQQHFRDGSQTVCDDRPLLYERPAPARPAT
jgi:glyceraldehyde 3-phosphate dehydrogenase